jgi:(p)ppGpp synthase/HD superfamily hydrolase
MMRQFELVELVKSYDPGADESLLDRAYVYSIKAHGTQLRASGDPYFSHPIEVAGLLAGMKLDTASIVTGLLHDTVEDTVATFEDIKRLFGQEIAHLVDGVTKLSRLELQSDQTKQAENFRKLVLAMSEDIRVLLVKLADRLHNMRTLGFIKEADKRRPRDDGDLRAAGRAHRHAPDEGRARRPSLCRALSRRARRDHRAAWLSARPGRRGGAADHRRARGQAERERG